MRKIKSHKGGRSETFGMRITPAARAEIEKLAKHLQSNMTDAVLFAVQKVNYEFNLGEKDDGINERRD